MSVSLKMCWRLGRRTIIPSRKPNIQWSLKWPARATLVLLTLRKPPKLPCLPRLGTLFVLATCKKKAHSLYTHFFPPKVFRIYLEKTLPLIYKIIFCVCVFALLDVKEYDVDRNSNNHFSFVPPLLPFPPLLTLLDPTYPRFFHERLTGSSENFRNMHCILESGKVFVIFAWWLFLWLC